MFLKMRGIIKKKNGFSLVEMLMAMLILMMAASIVVGGVPIAQMVLSKIVDTANAQVLMTTTMIRLRDEIGKATELSSDERTGIITYANADGRRSAIGYWDGSPSELWDGSSDVQGIYIREFYGFDRGSSDTYLLVSNAASNKNLYVDYSVHNPYNSSDGVFTISNLTVKKRNDPTEILASSDAFMIWVLSSPQS